MPTVAVVIPTYNRLELLKEAVAAVLAQTFADWELIVADDGSTDGSAEWLESLNDSRVAVVRAPHSANRSLLRNLGVASAHAPWIAFLDSDDLWLPDKLATQLEQLAANPTRRWSCTGVSFIDDQGAPIPQRAGAPYVAHSGWIIEKLLTFAAAATMSTLIVDKSLLDEVGGFDEAMLFQEDYDLALRLAVHSEIQALPEALTIMRDHAGRTSSGARVAELHGWTIAAFRKVARTTTNEHIRVLARRQAGAQLAQAARALSLDGEHGAALASAAGAVRNGPFTRRVWRVAVGCVVRALITRGASPVTPRRIDETRPRATPLDR